MVDDIASTGSDSSEISPLRHSRLSLTRTCGNFEPGINGGRLSVRTWRRLAALTVAAAAVAGSGRAEAQDRSQNNAVTQAEDAFGFSVGRESLGIYNAGNARGFSPTSAGNLRIDGLYYDQAGFAASLVSPLVSSTSIKVGLSAQGYPFAAPSGIVDIGLRKPGDKAAASVIVNGDSYGSAGVEIDGSLPVSSTLGLAYGLVLSRVAFPDGTDNLNHSQSLLLRWRPAKGVEIIPFWSLYNDYNDEAGVFYSPAGEFLPPLARPHRFEGARWTDFRFTATNHGVLGNFTLTANTVLRLAAFRSVQDQKSSFTNILANELPDGTGERIVFADPPTTNRSISGEARLTHSMIDGPRLHVVHLSIRERDAHRQFGGSAVLDYGPGRIGEILDVPKPASFDFGEVSNQHLTQTTYGVAYDGRWKNVGEISFSLSKAHYKKTTTIPGDGLAVARSSPWLYNGTAAANVSKTITVYAGYARGLEESGIAPANAANRNAPLPTIITTQKDAGARIVLGNLKLVGGVFDLTRPYFGFDSANVFRQVGTVKSRGAEFSISGNLTSQLSVVAGGVLIDGKVTRDAGVPGVIGSKPVGLSPHQLSLNANWKTPFKGLELDTAIINRAPSPGTTDNLVFIPAKWRWDVGTHYHFKLATHDATLRLQVFNISGKTGYNVGGSNFYGQNPGRSVQGFLSVDF
jgi:iron complex outermembrane receptor protein